MRHFIRLISSPINCHPMKLSHNLSYSFECQMLHFSILNAVYTVLIVLRPSNTVKLRMSGSLRLRYIVTLRWSDNKYLPNLSDQHYDRLKKCGAGNFGLSNTTSPSNLEYRQEYRPFFIIRFLWASNEKNWKFFPRLIDILILKAVY